MGPVLKAENLGYSYNGGFALADVSFEISAGEFFGIAGPNGCGKTTLLKLLSGAIAPQSGKILADGTGMATISPRRKAALLAFLPAEMSVPYDFTAREIAVMGRSPGLDWWENYSQEDYDGADGVLRLLGLEHAADKPVNALSSGERRKVFIAQALCQRPKILLLDEPTTHLDIRCQLQTFELLKDFAASRGTAVVVVSHDIGLVARYCGRLLLLKDGRPAALGTARETLAPANLRAVYGVEAETRADSEGGTHLLIKSPCKG